MVETDDVPDRETGGVKGTYKDRLDDQFGVLRAAIDDTETPYRQRPVAQLLGHLRWRRPDQEVNWTSGTTSTVPLTAAAMSIDIGTPLPDAMEVALTALAAELSGRALSALVAYHDAVSRLNAEFGVTLQPSRAGRSSGKPRRGGNSYAPPSRVTEVSEDATSTLHLYNSDLIDRGTAAHWDIQDALALHVSNGGLAPLSPQPDDQQFDLAWRAGSVLYICEVKSLTDSNEEQQMRLGLGQLLSYLCRTQLGDWPGIDEIRGVMAVERPPRRQDWGDICSSSGILLTWPEKFEGLLDI